MQIKIRSVCFLLINSTCVFLELADILINRRVKGGLTLLRMVEADNPKAVEYLCKKYKTFKVSRLFAIKVIIWL